MPSPGHRPGGSLSLAGTSAALRRGELKISEPIAFVEPGGIFSGPSSTVPPSPYLSGYPANDATWSRKSPSPQDFHVRHISDSPAQHGDRLSAGPSLVPGSMSSVPSKMSLNQKKAGGLRATLKRMFSSKRHLSVPSTGEYQYSRLETLQATAPQSNRRRLDSPSPLGATISRGAALTSHSVTHQTPDDIARSTPGPLRRRRRNTLPNSLFGDRDSSLEPGQVDWAQAEPSQGKKWAKDDDFADGQLKRRSRSADAINDLLRQSGQETFSTCDRVGQIAYWRNSVVENPVPVYSGQSIAVDPSHLVGPDSSVAESHREASTAVLPMQTFDFGLEDFGRDETTLEQRVNTLEIKLYDFEFAIAKLQGHDIPKPVIKGGQFNRGSIHGVFPNVHPAVAPTSRSPNGLGGLPFPVGNSQMTFLSSPEGSPNLSPEADRVPPHQRASRATNSTIRPATAREGSPRTRSSSPTSIHIPCDKFEALLEMVKDEKAARQRLEAQVMELQRGMDGLRAPVYATIRDPYPLPNSGSKQDSPNSIRTKTLHRTQGFRLDPAPLQEVSRFSGTEDSDAHEGVEEIYETPRERYTYEAARDTARMVAV